jgi:hypothetical protein
LQPTASGEVVTVPCPEPDQGPDFFNNMVAIAVVLMFTKVVSHRSHKTEKPALRGTLAVLHVLAVFAAAATVGMGVVATDSRFTPEPVWLNVSYALLFLTVAFLLIDVCLEAVASARGPLKPHHRKEERPSTGRRPETSKG